jgi:hypothetical protein
VSEVTWYGYRVRSITTVDRGSKVTQGEWENGDEKDAVGSARKECERKSDIQGECLTHLP